LPGCGGSGLLGRLARQAPQLARADAGVGTSRHERHRAFLDQAEVLPHHSSVATGIFHDHSALQNGADVDAFPVYHAVEPTGYFVVSRGLDRGERNEVGGTAHAEPPMGC
jgi:hypothetical protein